MKKIMLALLLFTVILSCKKKKEPEPEVFGTVENFNINGESGNRPDMTKITIGAVTKKCDDHNLSTCQMVISRGSISIDSLREGVVIDKIPLRKTGRFTLNGPTIGVDCDTLPPRASYVMVNTGDVIFASYLPDRTKDNFIQIEQFDSNTNEISGYFSVSMLHAGFPSERAKRLYGERIEIKNCKFKVKIL